jgi:hypothetical protein
VEIVRPVDYRGRHFSAEVGVGTGSQLGTVHDPMRNASLALALYLRPSLPYARRNL